MKLSASEQESLVKLLTRIYLDIRDIEEEFQLLVGGEDFRPRIEYFHDAVRTFSAQNPKGGVSERLAVERLAYDLSCLRYLQSMPLASFRPHAPMLSPQTDMVVVESGLLVKRKRPDRGIREHLSELYRHYAVLFAGLLKPFADNDYKERTEDMNQDVQDLHVLMQRIEQLAAGKGSLEQMIAAINHLENNELRQAMLAFIQQQKHKQRDNLKKMLKFLKQHSAARDKQIAAIEKAHMEYALSQLAIFEESRDMLKKMAAQGMNLVGKFVESAMAETKREIGR